MLSNFNNVMSSLPRVWITRVSRAGDVRKCLRCDSMTLASPPDTPSNLFCASNLSTCLKITTPSFYNIQQ